MFHGGPRCGEKAAGGGETEADEGEGKGGKKGGKRGKGGGEGGGVVSIRESPSPFRDNVTRLLELTGDIQLGLYECPVPFKRLLTPEELRWAADTGERRGEESTRLVGDVWVWAVWAW